MVREEVQKEMLRCRARRAWEYEKRIEQGRGSGLGRECRERKMKKGLMDGKVISEWEKGRKRFWEDRGIDIREIEEGRGERERILSRRI